MANVHPKQAETFEILDGGDIANVAPGQVHTFWNASDARACARAHSRPTAG